MASVGARFKRLPTVFKALIGLVAPIGTIIATLLALNLIQPVGGKNALAASADQVIEAKTAAIAVHYVSSGGGAPPTDFNATGTFDYRAGYGRFWYDFSATDAAEHLNRVEVRSQRRHVYIRLGGDHRRAWIHADLTIAHEQIEDYARAAGLPAPPPEFASIPQLDVNDPSKVLSQLRRASAVEELGDDRVFGVATRRFKAVIEPRGHGGRRLTAMVWIDANELIRRLKLTTDDGGSPFTMTMEFTDFGKPVAVRLPPPAKVRELEDVLAQLLT